jgi:hypothetical protein
MGYIYVINIVRMSDGGKLCEGRGIGGEEMMKLVWGVCE